MQGMLTMLDHYSSFSVLSTFIGMTTDSRSVLSFSRHEYFRRVLCMWIGEKVEKGIFPNDYELLKDVVDTFDNNLFAMIKYIVAVWINLSNLEKDIIIELLDQPLQRKDLANKLNVKSGTLSKYLTNLIQLDLISNNKGTYSVHENMLRRWLKMEYENMGVYPYRF